MGNFFSTVVQSYPTHPLSYATDFHGKNCAFMKILFLR